MKLQGTYLADFIALLFPELCCACGETLVAGEDLLCTDCHYNLPFTNFHLQTDNIVAQQYWGKVNLRGAYALYYFAKGGNVQNMMHQFKYKGVKRIGNVLGNIAGTQLAKSEVFNTVDLIVPVAAAQKPLEGTRL